MQDQRVKVRLSPSLLLSPSFSLLTLTPPTLTLQPDGRARRHAQEFGRRPLSTVVV